MKRTRLQRITVLAGLAVFAVVLPLVLNWRTVYYAIYPKERLYGRWKAIDAVFREPQRLYLDDCIEITTVEFLSTGANKANVLYRLDPKRPIVSDRYNTEAMEAVCKGGRAVARDRVAFPALSDLNSATFHSGLRQHGTETPRFRFDSDGRLILEHDEPFLPWGGTKLILVRAPEGE